VVVSRKTFDRLASVTLLAAQTDFKQPGSQFRPEAH
jgi:hypothetical protein